MSEKQEIFTLMDGRIKMYRGTYNPTSDAVWLAAFAGDTNVKTILDVGIGTGGVALCLGTHLPDAHITGIDVSDTMLTACAQNAELNNSDIELLNADIMTLRTARTFDMVVSNPPYFKGTPAIHNAHHNVDLVKWTRKCVARVRPRGYFCTIIDATVLADVISAMKASCGDIQILPLFGAGRTAERVLLRGRVGVHTGTKLHFGLSMNTESILRDGLTIQKALAKLGVS